VIASPAMSRPLLLAIATLTACSEDVADPSTTIRMRFDRAGSVYDAPWPSDDLRGADGRVRFTFPNPGARTIVSDAIAIINERARGFSLVGGVFFLAEGPLDPARFPAHEGSTLATSPVQLVHLDSGTRTPVEVSVTAEDTLYSPANVLSVLPLTGVPLLPRATYAAVVLRDLGDAAGRRLGQSPEMQAIAAGQRPRGLGDDAWRTYQRALDALALDLDDVAAVTVFTTDDPAAELARFREHALARPRPAPKRPFEAREVFDDTCVFHSTIDLPVYQTGTPPYATSGGGWPADPVVDHEEEAKLVVTVPRRPAPSGRVPVAVMVRTGGGGDRPLVDRGRQDASGAALEPGEGPGRYFARAGFAGASIDGPLGGLRDRGGDEQFTIFNVFNGRALRDNVRQSALELIVFASILDGLTVDASSCPGGPGVVALDTSILPIFGHSTGAWITPLVLAHEPRYDAAILSGAGAGWIGNVLYKERPLVVGPVVAAFLGLGPLAPGDPVLTLMQWAAEPADPQVYARRIAPRHILMEQGIVDHYILPRIANAISVPLGLDLAGEPRDAAAGLPAVQLPLEGLLRYSGRGRIALPASGNKGGTTVVVVQHVDDGVQDAHEIVFQRDEPKREYRCFLESLLAGTPRVPATGTGACD
jgi:hypothetical protein